MQHKTNGDGPTPSPQQLLLKEQSKQCASLRVVSHATMRGFTMIELMATVAVLAVLTSLAMPGFTDLVHRWRIMQTADILKSTLSYASSEARQRNGRVAVSRIECPAASKTTTDEWDCGWIVFYDKNDDGTFDDGVDEELQRYETPTGVQVTRKKGGTSIQFSRFGVVKGTWPSFNIVPEGKSVSHRAARAVCMSSGARARVTEEVPCT